MNLLQKLRSFMAGRYGFDLFGKFLFILSFVFWVGCLVFRFTPLRRVYWIFYILNTAVYIYAFYRILSKNIYKRQAENERYMLFRARYYPAVKNLKEKISARKADREHVFRKCPKCGTKLRLLRVHGRHRTKCPRCGEEFGVYVL